MQRHVVIRQALAASEPPTSSLTQEKPPSHRSSHDLDRLFVTPALSSLKTRRKSFQLHAATTISSTMDKKDKKDSKDKKGDKELTPDDYKMAFELRPQQFHSPPSK